MYPIRHYVRIDAATQDALDEICRHTFSTKSALMRRYIREGVKNEAMQYAEQVALIRQATTTLGSV